MYPPEAVVGVLILILLWLLVLSLLVWKERSYLRQLFPKTGDRDIRNKFKEVLEALEAVEGRNEVLNKNFKELAREGLEYIQRVEVLRYNPYGDTGGDQSFSVVLLNGKLNGLILTSLHSRAGTRIYTKPIKDGKSELELSKEEREVLKKATGSNF